MHRTRLLFVLLLLGPHAPAQSNKSGAAEIEQLQVKRDGSNVRIEVILTGAVKPTVDTAINPDRLVLTLPGTLSDAKQKHFMLNANGIEGVRVGLNSAKPPVTRVVVDMDSAHPYTMSADGKSIVLMVQAADTVSASKHSGPVPAASAPITSIFHKGQQPPAGADDTTAQAPIPVPPKLPPINFPPEKPANTQAAASSTPANTNPSAVHSISRNGHSGHRLGSSRANSGSNGSDSSGSDSKSTSNDAALDRDCGAGRKRYGRRTYDHDGHWRKRCTGGDGWDHQLAADSGTGEGNHSRSGDHRGKQGQHRTSLGNRDA